jgi:hypothetical protein
MPLRSILPWFSVLALGTLCGLPARAASRDGSHDMAMKTYVYMKQDSSIYLGEGVVQLEEFSGDMAQAIPAAKERARADLASGIRVQVKCEVSETVQSKSGKTSEDLSSRSKSEADLSLENIKYVEFRGLPEEGQVTVLASISKEDYRRQLAGKGTKVYLPENGLQFNFGFLAWRSLHSSSLANGNGAVDQSSPSSSPRNAYIASHPGIYNQALGGDGDSYSLGMAFLWRSWSIGVNATPVGLVNFPTYQGDGSTPAAPLDIQWASLDILRVSAGYDWTPLAWKLQPFVPLRVDYDIWNMNPYFAQTLGVSVGAGLRYWVNDIAALQVLATWHQGLRDGTVYYQGAPVQQAPGQDMSVSGSALELSASLILSTF